MTNLYPCQAYAGTILPWATTRIPSGWLWCNGQGYDPSVYPNLYQILGTRFGATRVPNLMGFFPMGSNSANNFPMGKTDGSTTVTFNDSQFPNHDHAVIQTVTTPQVNLSYTAGVPYNASDPNTIAVPGSSSVLGTAWVNQKGAKKPANIYSTQKQSVINMQLDITGIDVNFTSTTPTMVVGTPIAPWGEGESIEGPEPINPPIIPYFQAVVFIICANGGLPPHPINV
ncbi:MAG: tail fiber protein [Magnetococcales bacterium]|nr:tail fiber protein [Magnetococcales bacterium]